MATGGRKPKLTPDVQESICNYIRGGMTYEQAAVLSGVTDRTFHNWKSKGEKAQSGVYFQFFQAIKRANVEARALHINRIQKASKGGDSFEEVSTTEKTELREDPNNRGQYIEVVVARETKKTKKVMLPVWQASAWILERRFPSEFGRNTPVEPPDEHDPMQDWMDGLEEAQAKYGNA